MKIIYTIVAALMLAVPVRSEAPAILLSGQWIINMGKAKNTMVIKDESGVLKGTYTDDPAWGGASHSINGIRAGSRVQLFYQDERSADGYKSDFMFKGTIESEKVMSGNVVVTTVNLRGRATTNDMLWIGKRQ